MDLSFGMLVFVILAGAMIFPAQAVLREFNSTILSEKVTYYPNDYLSLDVFGEADDSLLYMNIDQKILYDLGIMFKLEVQHNGKSVSLPINTQLNVCTLLLNELTLPDSQAAIYRMSQTFGLSGYSCPIDKTAIKISPWIVKNTHNFDTDMACGRYNYQATLSDCKGFQQCTPLIMTEVEVLMVADECYL